MFNYAKHMSELKEYICQFCKKEYQSDGSRKPKSFRKDGTVYQYYDSSLFCSKECFSQKVNKRRKNTLKNNPEIMKQREIKRLFTLKNNPEIEINRREKIKQTYKKYPEIIERQKRTRDQTYKLHPEIREKQIETHKQTLRNNPEIILKRNEKHKQTLKNNPEIIKRARNKAKQTIKNYPEIEEQRRIKISKAQSAFSKEKLKSIVDRRKAKLQQTLLNNPEIIEKAQNKRFRAIKKKGFISKEEEMMVQLLKTKYNPSDVIEQYRDIRYSKPDSKYRYACDCYIKSLDLFIEYNGSRFHPTEGDKTKLKQEIEKFKLKYPSRNIKECQAYALLKTIENDKIKQQVARDNKLNYLIITDGLKELYENNIL